MANFKRWLEEVEVSALKRLAQLDAAENFDRQEVDQLIQQAIHDAKSFVPTGDNPSAAQGSFGIGEIGELAALLAGKKPAVWLGWLTHKMKKSGLFTYVVNKMLSMATKMGFAYGKPLQSMGFGDTIIADEKRQRLLTQLVQRYMADQKAGRPNLVSIHVEIGKLLGYPPEAIKKFTDMARGNPGNSLVHHSMV